VGPGLRFGVCTDQNRPFRELVQRWQLFEELGFDSVWDCDHLADPGDPAGPYFEAWTTLAGLACVTSRVRLGVLVNCDTFRHPVLVAKQALTLDHISEGRLELGLGAGWYEAEHSMYGIAFPPAGELVSRFEESVKLVDAALRSEVVDFDGAYHHLRAATFRPGPVQRPRPPILIGAKGPRMLGIAARHAEGWNTSGSPQECRERNLILDDHCARIGRNPREVARSIYYWLPKLSPDPWQSVEAFEHVVGVYRDAGMNEFIIDQPRDDQLPVLERVAAEALPRLRAPARNP
jgi:alkanesulfonate monooxygenase SsuD/methylene tetrahydromethanopterin reductase-like flavin-dependent oxidoreductase (luciferase family)